MDKETKIRCDIDLTFEDYFHNISIWNLIGAGHNVDVLKKLVDAYFNSDSDRRMKIPRILITGAAGSGKRTVAHAFVNSLCIENVTYIESEFLDAPGFSMSSKYVFENRPDKAVIVSHIENLTHHAEFFLWQYLSTGKCCYGKLHSGDWEIVHYDGILILTANKKELVSKQILNNIDVIIELEPYQDFQIRKILEQRINYMKLKYEVSVINLLLNSSENKIDKLMRLLKLGVISMISQDRNELLVRDIEFALENLR